MTRAFSTALLALVLLSGCGDAPTPVVVEPGPTAAAAAGGEREGVAASPSEPPTAISGAREARPRVDTRARLDLRDLPPGVCVDLLETPVSGLLVLQPGEHRLTVHCDGVLLRSFPVELRIGETTSPDFGWVTDAVAHRRRHTGTRAARCRCKRSREHGIDWIVTHRSPDGAWRADSFTEKCGADSSCGGAVADVSPTETTGLALLALVGIGETHYQGRYRSAVRGAATFLIDRQDEDGLLDPDTRVHAIGTLALTELLVMTGSRRYRAPAQRALDALPSRRREGFGWTEHVGSRRPDAETTCWAVFATVSGAAAKLDVPSAVRSDLLGDLALFGDPGRGEFAPYEGAMLTLARFLCAEGGGDPLISSGVERIASLPPSVESPRDPRFLWFGAAVIQTAGGEDLWKTWSRGLIPVVKEPLIESFELLEHAPPVEMAPEAILLGRLRATIYRQLTFEILERCGRVFGASSR